TNGRRALDVTVLAALFGLGVLGFHHVYGGIQYLLTGLMALVFGTLIALIGARWRWGPLRITPLLLLVYFLFGPMFAAPTRAIWGSWSADRCRAGSRCWLWRRRSASPRAGVPWGGSAACCCRCWG